MNGIYFPGIGIYIKNVLSGFSIFGLNIKFYGVIIAAGFIFAYLLSCAEAKRTGQNKELYLDLLITLAIPSILGARIYYIIFNLKNFISYGKSTKEIIWDMINVRGGGLAIYGGLIAGAITIYFFGKHKKVSPLLILDTITMGILIGQIMGRWGNFFNREVFGEYTNSIFRMAIPLRYYSDGFLRYLFDSGIVTEKMINNQEMVNGVSCITVHPTFMYEILWNVLLLLFILWYRKRKRFDGEIITIYFMGYGIGRFFIEAIRTDSLMIGCLKVSQVVAVLCVFISVIILIINRGKKYPVTLLSDEESSDGKEKQLEEKEDEIDIEENVKETEEVVK